MSAAKPIRLRCEYLRNPLAIDTPTPRLSWIIETQTPGVSQSAWQVLVADSLDALQRDEGTFWDSGRIESDQMVHNDYAGQSLPSRQMAYWKVRVWDQQGQPSDWSEPANWRMGLLRPGDWQAQWISAEQDESDPLPKRPSPLLRREFALRKPVRRAFITATALGLYELHLNGRQVGDRLLTPEWTDYHKRLLYQVYEVTDLLKEGSNAIGAMLADGWYAGRLGICHVLEEFLKNKKVRAHYGKRLQLLLRLDVEYEDGTAEAIVSDTEWKGTTDGPVREACLLDGEVVDARKEPQGWNRIDFDDRGWPSVEANEPPATQLVAQTHEPIRITEDLPALNITEPQPGIYVVDFGQNLSGVCRMELNLPAGTTIRLRHAEVLSEDGNIYRDNLRMGVLGGEYGARQEDRYTARGDGQEIFQPRFVYHGFRYVEIAGLPEKPDLSSITARAFHSAPEMTGGFECSEPMLNKLMKNIVWTHRNNLHSVPTDCPQRDERMGWSGDMLIFAQPACFNMDMAAFLSKWSRDLSDDQADDGRFPDFAPQPYDPNLFFSGNPAWGDVGVFVPWTLWLNYGDTRLLEQQFEPMQRWVDFIHTNNPELLWTEKLGYPLVYGDWLNGDTLKLESEGFPQGEAEMPKEVFATAFFFRSTQMLAQIARLTGRTKEADQYQRLADGIRKAFIQAYVDEDARVKGHTQAGYALALYFDLIPAEKRARAAEHMVERVRSYRNHISTGFLTTVMLMHELSRAGYNDIAYMLINNRTIPSWGYTIDHGATTIWERWDGYVAGRGYQDPGMNSFNHYAIGTVGEWMYQVILGINPDQRQPGYKHILLRPQPGNGLTWAKGHYDSIHGRIESAWQQEGGTITYRFTVPANTTATALLPAGSTEAVEVEAPAGSLVESRGMQDGYVVYELQPGQFTFKV